MVLKMSITEECALLKSTTMLTFLPDKKSKEENAAAAPCSFTTIPTWASFQVVCNQYRFGCFKVLGERERAGIGPALTALTRGTSTPLSRMEPMWTGMLPIRSPRAHTSGRMSQAKTLRQSLCQGTHGHRINGRDTRLPTQTAPHNTIVGTVTFLPTRPTRSLWQISWKRIILQLWGSTRGIHSRFTKSLG